MTSTEVTSSLQPTAEATHCMGGESRQTLGRTISKPEVGPNVVDCGLLPKWEQSPSWLPMVPSLTAKPAKAFQWEEQATLDLDGPREGEGNEQTERAAALLLGVQEMLTMPSPSSLQGK